MFSKARETSEIVLQRADQTEYYDYIDYSGEDSSGNRIVGFETIIPTLYKYDKERYKVTFKTGTLDEYGNVTNLEPLAIYKTTTNPSTYISSFDIEEEVRRGEPWLGSSIEIKKNLDAIFSGTKYMLPQYGDNNHYIDYSVNPNNVLFKYQQNSKRFVELIGKITTTEETVDNITGIRGNKTTTKTIITYVLIN